MPKIVAAANTAWKISPRWYKWFFPIIRMTFVDANFKFQPFECLLLLKLSQLLFSLYSSSLLFSFQLLRLIFRPQLNLAFSFNLWKLFDYAFVSQLLWWSPLAQFLALFPLYLHISMKFVKVLLLWQNLLTSSSTLTSSSSSSSSSSDPTMPKVFFIAKTSFIVSLEIREETRVLQCSISSSILCQGQDIYQD